MPENLPVISGYEILEVLGQGGMSVIYKAIQKSLDRKVVIKVLHSHLASNKNFVARLEREAKAAGSLKHPNVVDVIDFSNEGDLYYMVMEYIEGQSIKDLIEKYQKIPMEVTASMIHEVCKGLDCAHSRGITHRDIKPANIMIDKDGIVKVTDFGLALVNEMTSLTVTGTLVGTPAYMSPEQAAGKKPDNRSDIFSTGVVMYEMLTGKNPFAGETYTAVITKLIMEQPASVTKLEPIISEDLARIVEKAMEKDVDKRYQDIKDMIDDLEKYLEKVGAIRIDKLLKDYLNNPEGIAQKMRESNISRHLEKGVYYMNLGLEKIDNAMDEFKNVLALDPDNQKAKDYFNELTIKKQSATELPVIQKTSTTEDKKTSVQPPVKTEVIPIVDTKVDETKKETEEKPKESLTSGKDTIKLGKETIQLQPAPVSVPETEQPLSTIPSQPTTPVQPIQPTVSQKKKGGGGIVIVLIIVIFVVIGLVSLLVWLWSEGFIG